MLRLDGGNSLKFGNLRLTKIRREASPATGIWGPLYSSSKASPTSQLSSKVSLSQIQSLDMDAGKAVVSSLLAAVQTWPGFGYGVLVHWLWLIHSLSLHTNDIERLLKF